MSGVLHKISFRAFYEAISYASHGGGIRVRVSFPYVKLGVATLLAATPGRITSTQELVEWIYGEREDGGPAAPEACIKAAVRRLRHEGFPIETHPGRGHSYEGHRRAG